LNFSLRKKLTDIPIVLVEVLFVIIVVFGFMFWLLFYSPSLYWQTLPEFLAAILGVCIGFSITRWFEYLRDAAHARQVLKFIKEELSYNKDISEKIAKKVDETVTPSRSPFKLFKTHAWDVFNEELRIVRNVKLVLDLGELYHELLSINEAMKISPIDNASLPQRKASWKKISNNIQHLIERIDDELKIKKRTT